MRLWGVRSPTIEVFLPTRRSATGSAVLIFPGGGYSCLAYDLEGIDVARWWSAHGVAAIVVKYRLPGGAKGGTRHEIPLADASRAMRIVRAAAPSWGVDPRRIGVLGFSAGGHLASTLSTHFDAGRPEAGDAIERQSCRPDFSILVYPVISFGAPFAHLPSRRALLGEHPQAEVVERFSGERNVRDDTPPAFLIHATDDDGVLVENSLAYFCALRERGVGAALRIFEKGGHGFGLALSDSLLGSWSGLCLNWLHSSPRA